MLMTAWKWGPALAAGCTIVMKPAEQTPLTCLRMAKLAQEAGFPDGVINVVPGYGPTAGGSIVAHPMVDKIAFTGEHTTAQNHSAGSGRYDENDLPSNWAARVRISCLPMPTSTQRFAGSDAGLFFNMGQCCCAGSRLFVEESIHDAFVERMLENVAGRKLGDPLDPSTEQGPQVDQAQFDKIMKYIGIGQEQGATCAAGGNRVGDRGYFIEPTIFTDVTDEMQIATDEIFGPVMSILKFRDTDELIERANNTMYGLAAAVWTRDVERAHKIANSIRAGTVWINCYDAFDAAAPFGGFKMSGLGRELGEAALNNYLEDKTVTVALS